ncbi:hypothetical protein [Streptomyces sp. NPDC055060]
MFAPTAGVHLLGHGLPGHAACGHTWRWRPLSLSCAKELSRWVGRLSRQCERCHIRPMSGADFGDVPTWVGTLLTGGSLFLAFYIMLRDRRNAEQQEARKVALRVRLDTDGVRLFSLHNGSDRTVDGIGIFATAPDQALSGLMQAPRATLAPGATSTEWRITSAWLREGASVTFVDSNGVRWVRSFETHHLIRIRRRLRRGLRGWLEERMHRHQMRKLLP